MLDIYSSLESKPLFDFPFSFQIEKEKKETITYNSLIDVKQQL